MVRAVKEDGFGHRPSDISSGLSPAGPLTEVSCSYPLWSEMDPSLVTECMSLW